jgi:glycosyltransferase involved in cell wall biosynthesis
MESVISSEIHGMGLWEMGNDGFLGSSGRSESCRGKRMTRVLLLQAEGIEHYRIPVYNFFLSRFEKDGIEFQVAGPSMQRDGSTRALFRHFQVSPSFQAWKRIVQRAHPQVVIFRSLMRNRYVIPFLLWLRFVRIPVIYWGHGINLGKKESWRKLYDLVHGLCNAIILHSENEKQYIRKRIHNKVFTANNTLYLENIPRALSEEERKAVLRQHDVRTGKNVIFVGRMQRRKKVGDLLQAARRIRRPDIGLLLVGPNTEDVVRVIPSEGVVHIPGLYGEELLKLMLACDVYCCPGWVGLNIVEAMACGLPFVTESGDNAPEIVYLKDGVNGIIVPEGRSDLLANQLVSLLDDDSRRKEMSKAARKTFEEEANIDKMYMGFFRAVKHVFEHSSVCL